MRFLLVALLSMIAVIAAAAAIYGLVLGSWVHGLIELTVAVLAGAGAYLVRDRKKSKTVESP